MMPQQPNPVLTAIDTGLSLPANEITVYFAADGEQVDFVENQRIWNAYGNPP